MEAATGERIVAFGRAGKPLEKAFFRPFCTSIEARRITGYASPATDFKAASRKALVGGTSGMALLSSKKRESRKSLSQPGWITLEGGFAARQCVVKDLSTTGASVGVKFVR